RAVLTLGAAALGAFLMAAVLHPIWPLQVVSLSLMSISLAGLAWLLAKRIDRPAREAWVDWLALGTAGLALGWLFLIPYLLLPFSLQVICRILGVSLSLVAAVAFRRALPRHLRRLGALFPLAPIALSFLLPLGPARWEIGPLSTYEVQFAGRMLVTRAVEGPVLTYYFPRENSVAVAGFAPYRVMGCPGLALGPTRLDPLQLQLDTPGWVLTLAALESERQVGIATIYSGGVRDRYTYVVQTESHLLSVIPGPEHTFFAVYRDRKLSVRAQRVNIFGKPLSDPIQLPSRAHALAVSRDAPLIACVDGEALRGVWVVDLETGEDVFLDLSQEIAALGGEDAYIHSLAIAPDGSELALGLSWKEGMNCPGLIWRVDIEGNVLAQLLPPTWEELGHEPFVSILRYSPDGKRLVAEICCFPSRLSVVDVDSGRVRNLPLGGRGYRDAVFSPDGQYLVATRYDGIYLWRIGR
ncbi:hypothetical protein DRJ54_02820, partial [Candidatus Acetothermia bacterium]